MLSLCQVQIESGGGACSFILGALYLDKFYPFIYILCTQFYEDLIL